MTKRNIFLWILYDFANSFVVITFFLYLSQWLVIDAGLSSFWFNSIFVGSTILLLFSAPILAGLSDKIQKRRMFLNIMTIGAFICYGATALVAGLGTEYVWWVAGIWLLAQYFYQFSFVFYNPMIDELAPLEKRGRLSGLGQTANWIGQLAGILVALLFASSGRVAPLLPSVLIFFTLSLPMMIFFKETKPQIETKITLRAAKEESRRFASRFYQFLRYSPAAVFLVAFFFFNDAILTLSHNFPIYMQKVFEVTDNTKSLLLLAILVMSALGAYLSGWLGDKIGMKKTIKIILGAWMVIIPVISLTTSLALFSAVTIAVGILYGSIWSVTRAYLSGILPREEMNYGFSFYTLAERFATFAGPLTWGLIVGSFAESPFGYRTAALLMTVFVIIGYLFVKKIPEYKIN